MRNFWYKLMYGRYGMDTLNGALLWAYLIVAVAECFLRWKILYWLSLALFVIVAYRFLSRDTWQRQQENTRFTAALRSCNTWFHFQTRKMKEWRTFRYRKCPHCSAVLRLPRKRGKHDVCCPRCHEDFSVTIRL